MELDDNLSLFLEDVKKYDSDFVVSKWILEKVPYIFKDNHTHYISTKLEISHLLNIDSCSIIFVGSACTGFSLNPIKGFKKYNDSSDIDIALISHYYFDVAWHTLRNIDLLKQTPETASSIKEHRERLIYWGTIATDKILGLMPFGRDWLNAISKIQNNCFLGDRDIKFRLYRNHESLRAYHINNINRIKKQNNIAEAKIITL